MTPSSAGKRRRPVGQEPDSSPLPGTKSPTLIKRRKLSTDGSSPSTPLKKVVVEITDSTPKRKPRARREAKIISKLPGRKSKKDRVSETAWITKGPPSLEETGHENDSRQTRALSSRKVVRKDFLSERQLNTNEDPIEIDIDNTTCNVCGDGDSTESNQILLCDSCDNAFHQECYDVPVIPDDDWFCRDCHPSDGGSLVESEALMSLGKRRRPVDRGNDRRKASDMAVSPRALARRQPGQEPGSSPLLGTIGRGNDRGKASDTALSPRALASRRLGQEPGGSPLSGTKSPASIKLRKLGVDRSAHGAAMEKFDTHLGIMKKLLLEKLTGRRALQLRGLDDAYENVHQVVEQTVLAGEGNSMLIIGARGCGKTTLVEQVVSDLSDNHREKFHVVRLNGFIHVDDKLALRDIWRQLGREMEVEDELTSKVTNYADTLTSLLALLSHPSEISEVEADQTANSVIFILDEFDLFTSHPRQTLLYNLFDVAQSRKAPIAVLGLTTRIDVVESLEKRVKSRFSHRYAHISLPRNLPAYWEICKQGLLVGTDELIQEGVGYGLNNQEEFQSFWESMIETLYSEDLLFRDHLQMHFYRSKSVTSFLTSCILPVAGLTPTTMPLSGKSFVLSNSLSPPDSKLHLLQSLSDLDLALLIAAARLDIILDTDTCNFTMAYDEYSRLTSKHKIQTSSTGVAALGAGAKIWGREVAIGSWEHLIDCELLMPAGMGGVGTTGRDIGREWKMWKADVGLEEIPGSVDGLSGIMAKWCREI